MRLILLANWKKQVGIFSAQYLMCAVSRHIEPIWHSKMIGDVSCHYALTTSQHGVPVDQRHDATKPLH
jgi:hypothetical protein